MPGIASAATAVVIGARRGRHPDDPGRGRRDHAAEPRAADRRRGLRHAGDALPGADRPRARAGAGHRHADDAGAAPAHGRRRPLPAGRARAARLFRRARSGGAGPGDPRQGTGVPVWILGSSLYGAQLAAHLGLPYAFASHFAPQELETATAVYRPTFQPSPWLAGPQLMLALNVFAADSDAEAPPAALVAGAGLRQPAHRQPRTAAAAGGGHRGAARPDGTGDGRSGARPAPRSARRRPCGGRSRASSTATVRTN